MVTKIHSQALIRSKLYRPHVGEDLVHRSRLLERLDITCDRKGEPPSTLLCGLLLDQAALLGMLNALYGLHRSLLSVEHLDNE